MAYLFATGNQQKFEEAKEIFARFGLQLEWLKEPKPEPVDCWDIRRVAENAAQKLAQKHHKPVIVEDTGFFFSAYNNFPGPHSKFSFYALGYEGLLKLLEGKDRSASFKVAAAFCKPGKKPHIFEGKVTGKITEKPHGDEAPTMPFDRIFIPEGQDKAWILTPEIKMKISHRVEAFEKLAQWLKEGENG